MTYVLRQIVIGFVVVSIVMLTGYARGQAPANVSGVWTGTTQRGATTIRLDLKQEGQKVTGTLSGFGATDDGPVEGTIDGNTIKLRSKTGTAPTLNLKGDVMTGMTTSSGPVTLKRAK